MLNRIEVLLKQKGLMKKDLYRNCGITASAISQWKTGDTTPSVKSIHRIADYLGVSYEYLVSGSDNKKDPATNRDEISFERWMAIYESLSPAGREELDSYARYLKAKEAGQ